MKSRLLDFDPAEHVHYLGRESDRAMIILEAAALEETLLEALKNKMGSLDNDERARIFGFEGPCGSFSNRIRIAQGLGIINRPMRRKFEIIKEMRNVAAHCHFPIGFEVPQIRNAVAALFSEKARKDILTWPPANVRMLFSYANVAFVCVIIPNIANGFTVDEAYAQVAKARVGALPDK